MLAKVGQNFSWISISHRWESAILSKVLILKVISSIRTVFYDFV